jgi:hypothetical protein
MADITIFKPAALTIDIIEGVPPTDQSALVAQLQGKIDAARTAAQAAKDADAATVDGQAVLDALA